MRKRILGALMGAAVTLVNGMASADTLALYQFTANTLISSDTDMHSTADPLFSSGISDVQGVNSFDFADTTSGGYLDFKLSPDSNYTLNLTQLSFTATRSTNAGNVDLNVYSNLTGYTTPLYASNLGVTAPLVVTIDLSSDGAFQNIGSGGITFRLSFAANQDKTNRFTSIDDITVDGMSVELPPAVWLMGSGLIGLVGIGRRKLT